MSKPVDNPLELHEVSSMLSYIHADERDTWIRVGMGLRHEFGEVGFEAYDSWSQTGNGYKAASVKSAWKSFRGDALRIASVIQMAQQNGWKREQREMPAAERERMIAERAAAQAKRAIEDAEAEALELRMRAKVAEACRIVWNTHCDEVGDSAYLNAKEVKNGPARFINKLVVLDINSETERVQIWVGDDADFWLKSLPKPKPDTLSMMVLRGGMIVVPLFDNSGALQSIQSINHLGTKMFPKYGSKSGCYSLIGSIAGASVVAVAEGFATAASVHAATGWPTAVAIDSGNLGKVCAALVEKHPDVQLIIAGDDDPKTPGNPGRTAAVNAAELCGGIAVFPTGGKEGDDWNDLQISLGVDAIKAQLLAGLKAGNLPHTPTNNGGPAENSASAATGGAGEGLSKDEAIARKLLGRFALVEGKTDVWDGHKFTVMRKSAFEAMTGKENAAAWFANLGKKLIDQEQARLLVEQRKMQGKALKDGWAGMTPVERYIYIDGTKDIWDKAKRRRIPEGALKLMLGDTYPLWLNAPDRRVVDMEHIVFDPAMKKDPDVYINTFEGLPLEPDDDADKCIAIRGLIDFLCNNDPDAVRWLTSWLAYPLQNMGAKMDTAVLLHSTMEGSGKSLFLSDIMGQIYGQYSATVGQSQLESSWTVWQSGKLYAVFEEVVSRDQRYNQVGKIKHMVTGKTVRMESKFVNGWEEANHMNAVFLSNEIMPWPISENDRRMFVMWPQRTLPPATQKAVAHELANGGVAALFGYLLNYDLGDFDERTRPPFTYARQQLVALSRASWENFIVQWRTGGLGVPYTVCRTQDLHDLYLEWCKRSKENTLSETKFSLFVSTKVPKTEGSIFWMDGHNTRRRSILFVPDSTEDEKPLRIEDLSNAKEMGNRINEWRKKAYWAGWSVSEWEKCIGWIEPLQTTNPKDAA